jgi:hypothetical protein
MMAQYAALSDDYYVNMHLNTEMDLPYNREAILHYFERLQKQFPTMRNFYTRERSEFVLEEDKERGDYRWASVEPRRVCAGAVNASSLKEAFDLHRLVLDVAPYALTLSPLDCDSLNIMIGFDYTYRGNHSALVAEALGMTPAYERMAEIPGATVLNHEPSLQLALDEDCRLQCRLSIETRTSAYNVRVGEFPEDQFSVYLTVRRYGSLEPGETYPAVMKRLAEVCTDLVDNYIVEHVLRPLQKAIAIK